MLVGVIGGAGHLGRVIARTLPRSGIGIRVIDIAPGADLPDAEYRKIDTLDLPALRDGLRGVDAVIHLAAMHGPDTIGRRRECWRVNVDGSDTAVRAALDVGAKTFILASSTRIYGVGTETGPARVQHEDSPISPDDVYSLTKLTAERIVLETARRTGLRGVCLRMGGFWGDPVTCELRKLSTGLDPYDAALAYQAVLQAPDPVHGMYLVASDLDLPVEVREEMGVDLPGVVREHCPELLDAARALGVAVPPRIGKSTSTGAFRRDFAWRPRRDVRWWSREVIKGRWSPNGHAG